MTSYNEILVNTCQAINQLIKEDTPAFTPNGPFKKASSYFPDKQGWRTLSLTNETLILTEVKLNSRADGLIFVFTGTVDNEYRFVEMSLGVAEAHLNDFKEYLLMGLELDCYLSEFLQNHKVKETGRQKEVKKKEKQETQERRNSNLLWGTW